MSQRRSDLLKNRNAHIEKHNRCLLRIPIDSSCTYVLKLLNPNHAIIVITAAFLLCIRKATKHSMHVSYALSVTSNSLAAGKGYAKMREGTLRKLTEFMETLLELVSLESARPGTHLPTRSLDGTPSAHGKHSSLARCTLKHSHSEEATASQRMRPLHTPHSSTSSSSHSPSPTGAAEERPQPRPSRNVP